MGFWMIAGVWLLTYVLGTILRDNPKNTLKPSGLDDFSFPTADASRKIPIIAGSVLIKGPNLIWYGDFRTKAIKKSSGGMFGFGKQTQVIGFKYYVGMHFAICHGQVNSFNIIKFDEKIAWEGTFQDGAIDVKKPELFGDKDAEGGINARIYFHSGSTTQLQNPYLVTQLGGDGEIPAFRGIANIVWGPPSYIGNSAQIRPISFGASRYPHPLGSGKHIIGSPTLGDANPAELLWELHTSKDWGAGMDSSLLDSASFLAAANTLYAENMGISIFWGESGETEKLVEAILDQIDAIIYSDINTGKRVLKLIRDDFNIATIPQLNTSNILELSSYSRGSWDETTNEVVVDYIDRSQNYEKRTAIAQDLANQQIQQVVVSNSLEFLGVSNAELASRIAWRELRATSQPLAKLTIKCNRTAYTLRPGDVFALTWAPLGITDLVCRVSKVNLGGLEDGEIEIDAIQDVYSLKGSIYAQPQASQWIPLTSSPTNLAVGEFLLIETPYQIMASDTSIAAADRDKALLSVAIKRGTSDALGYQIHSRISPSEYVLTGTGSDFTPRGHLQSILTQGATSFTLITNTDVDLLEADSRTYGASLVIVNDEWIAYDPSQVIDNGDGSFTFNNVWRGRLDTTQKQHAANSSVWFYGESNAALDVLYTNPSTLDVKLLPTTSTGTLPIASATQRQITFTRRPERPYRPDNVKINGSSYPATITGAYTISWSHRDRLQETTLTAPTAASIGPEAGTTYTLRLYGQTGLLKRTETGITGNSFTWTTEDVDSGLSVGVLNTSVRAELESVRDGLTSHQMHNITVTRV